MAGYLPKEWNGKRVAVRFARGRGFDARLVENNAGGITVEPVKEEDAEDEEERARSAFVPWAAVGISSCWKNPASARGLDQNALPPRSRRSPRLSWLRKPSKGFRPRPECCVCCNDMMQGVATCYGLDFREIYFSVLR